MLDIQLSLEYCHEQHLLDRCLLNYTIQSLKIKHVDKVYKCDFALSLQITFTFV